MMKVAMTLRSEIAISDTPLTNSDPEPSLSLLFEADNRDRLFLTIPAPSPFVVGGKYTLEIKSDG